jgi:hypothetical protein
VLDRPRAGKDATTLNRRPGQFGFRAGCAPQIRGDRGHLPRAIATSLILALALTSTTRAEIDFPPADRNAPIVISADRVSRWQEGQYEVLLLQGNCVVSQGTTAARGSDAVLWIDQASAMSLEPNKVVAYLEGHVRVEFAQGQLQYDTPDAARRDTAQSSWVGRFYSTRSIQLRLPVADPPPAVKPPVYQRSLATLSAGPEPAVQPAQFTAPLPPGAPAPGPGPPVMGSRRIEIYPRTSTRIQGKWFPSPTSDEWVAVVDSGVNVIVEGMGALGKIDVSTDRLVMWTRGVEGFNLSGASFQRDEVPLEIYMEGNIVFRQADRVIYAERMYYNISGQYGVVLQAEMLTPVPQYQGLVRLKADILQQLNRTQFQAFGGSLTSSRMGVPRYWLQSRNVYFEDIQQPIYEPFTGQPVVDPATREVAVDHQLMSTSRNNFLYLGGVPVFWWPLMATDLTEPSFYVESLRLSNDRIFGTQIGADLNMYQLLGWRNPPRGTKWVVPIDYMSDRGLGLGTYFQWNGADLVGVPGPYWGKVDAWGIKDKGLDTLGAGRSDLAIPQEWRGRVRAQHRQMIPGGFQLSAEVGWASDRNFVEQYFPREWDELKDQTTGIELKQYLGNHSWSVSADYRLTDSITQTNNLPRGDHFMIGQSLLGDRLTWHAHSQIGYAQLKTATLSSDPADPSEYLPWERATGQLPTETYGTRQGIKAATRHEIDAPLQLGPVKVVPYALGEVGYWQEDRDGLDVTRYYGQTGVRASLPIWKADPAVQNTLLNMNGMAHKIVLDAEFFYADASTDVDRFPLYEPTNDDSIEAFQRRFKVPLGPFFGVPDDVVARYDDRYFALRSGIQGNVTASPTELADDLLVLRGGIHQRWQTKRGMPGEERIIDWIVFDVNAAYYPEPQMDPFGTETNMNPFAEVDYDFSWHVGDRVSLVSEGYFDTFGGGLRTMSVGGVINRPDRGRLYLGYRWYDGPFKSNVILAALNYRMSEKWTAVIGTTMDLDATGNVAQSVRITRIGESLLLSLGFAYSLARDNVGVQFMIEPRFMNSRRLTRVAGVSVGPAGQFGLE